MSFWTELRRRNVFKVGTGYALVAWILVQVVGNVFPVLHLPEWTGTFVIVLLLLGFPLALVLAWAFEVTPDGIKRTADIPLRESIRHLTGQKLNYIVTALLVLAVALMAADNYVFTGNDASGANAAAAASSPPTVVPVPPSARAGAATTRTVLPNSVGVLPFANLSPNADDAYFAAGIHEEILNYLAKLKSLSVIGRTSMMRYAETDKSSPEIATELNVATVMEGSVRYANGRVRVTTQLNDGVTGAHLWSEAYERDFKDIFAIQADVAMSVANALNAAFSPEEQQRIEAVPNVSADTYATYLRVLPALGGAGNQGPQIVAVLDQMIGDAPDFAAPHGWKAFVLANLLINTTFGSAGDRSATQTLARTSADRALALDPNDAQAHSALAQIEMVNWLWPEVRQRYARNSGAPSGLASLYSIWFLSWTGRDAEAIAAARRGIELSPFEAGTHWYLGMSLSYAEDYDEAVAAFERAIDLAPAAPLFHTWLAYAEIGRGGSEAAMQELRLTEQLLGSNRAVIYVLDMLYAYGRLGRTEDAQRLFEEIQSVARNQDIGAGGWAQAYLAMGDQQKALEQLREGTERARNKVLDPGFFQLMNIRMNATADPVLEQPEFAAVRAALSGD